MEEKILKLIENAEGALRNAIDNKQSPQVIAIYQFMVDSLKRILE